MFKNIEKNLKGINTFNIKVTLSESSVSPERDNIDSHIHEECEIYLNLSGNVSFMVENNIYKVNKGDIIITKPYEYHHCIYHSNDIHKHFWILFSCAGNKELFGTFFNRNVGENNIISLSESKKEKLIKLCYDLLEAKNELKDYLNFLSIIDLISENKSYEDIYDLPDDVKLCIEYINKNFNKALKISDVSEKSFVTVNTLERHFKKYLGISPYEYIINCRLSNAASVLIDGGNVTQASEESGFPDYSHFIALFKKRYGKTPLQFKKEL